MLVNIFPSRNPLLGRIVVSNVHKLAKMAPDIDTSIIFARREYFNYIDLGDKVFSVANEIRAILAFSFRGALLLYMFQI